VSFPRQVLLPSVDAPACDLCGGMLLRAGATDTLVSYRCADCGIPTTVYRSDPNVRWHEIPPGIEGAKP